MRIASPFLSSSLYREITDGTRFHGGKRVAAKRSGGVSAVQDQDPADHCRQGHYDRDIHNLSTAARAMPTMPEVVVNRTNFARQPFFGLPNQALTGAYIEACHAVPLRPQTHRTVPQTDQWVQGGPGQRVLATEGRPCPRDRGRLPMHDAPIKSLPAFDTVTYR